MDEVARTKSKRPKANPGVLVSVSHHPGWCAWAAKRDPVKNDLTQSGNTGGPPAVPLSEEALTGKASSTTVHVNLEKTQGTPLQSKERRRLVQRPSEPLHSKSDPPT